MDIVFLSLFDGSEKVLGVECDVGNGCGIGAAQTSAGNDRTAYIKSERRDELRRRLAPIGIWPDRCSMRDGIPRRQVDHQVIRECACMHVARVVKF